MDNVEDLDTRGDESNAPTMTHESGLLDAQVSRPPNQSSRTSSSKRTRGNTDRTPDKLREAANVAATEARSAYLTFGGVALYILITVAGTTHEQLLRGSIITMPLFGIDIPIVGYYFVVPLLFVLAHLNLLLQLSVLAGNLDQLLRDLSPEEQDVQERLLNPFSRFLIARHAKGDIARTLMRLIAFCSVVLLPLVVLIATQIGFLPYHSETVAWWHRTLIILDLLLLSFFWPRITRHRRDNVPQNRRWQLDRHHGFVVALCLPIVLLLSATTTPDELLERAVLRVAGFRFAVVEAADEASPQVGTPCGSWLSVWTYFRVVEVPDGEHKEAARRKMLCLTSLLFEKETTPLGIRRNLILTNADLVVARPDPQLMDDSDESPKEAWEDAGRGFDLRGRDLRFANLSDSDLRKADLRGANLEGAKLKRSTLSYATLKDIPLEELDRTCDPKWIYLGACRAHLKYANFENADLRSVQFWRAELSHADLSWSNLQNADLSFADLRNANLEGANLSKTMGIQGANLVGADLRDAKLTRAKLLGVNLSKAKLTGTDLTDADLTDANFSEAWGACHTTMPDGSICNRDCFGPSHWTACPWLDAWRVTGEESGVTDQRGKGFRGTPRAASASASLP